MFTNLSMKFVIILKHFYSNVYLVKPLTSRESNSERYVVCKGFKYDEKNIKDLLAKMMKALDKIAHTGDQRTADSDFFADIFPSIQIPTSLARQITSFNVSLVCSQYKVINKMIEFIDGSNYHGDAYKDYRDRQIELSKHWIEKFFPDVTDKNKAIKDTMDMIELSEKDEDNSLALMLKGYADYVGPKTATSKAVPKVAPKANARAMARSTAKTTRSTKVAKTTKAAKAKPKTKTGAKSKAKASAKARTKK